MNCFWSSAVMLKGNVGAIPGPRGALHVFQQHRLGEPGGPKAKAALKRPAVQFAHLGEDIGHLGDALKIQNRGGVGLEANAEIRAPHSRHCGVGLDDEIRLGHLEQLVDHHVGHPLEEVQHGIAFLLSRIELVLVDGQPAFRGQGDDAVVDKGDLGFGQGLGAEHVPGLHLVLELHRDGRQLPPLQEVHPAFHLGNVSHHLRLSAGQWSCLEGQDHEYHPRRMYTFS